MAAIPLDPDIAAATASTTPGSLTLDKINAQHYRNALADQAKFHAESIRIEQETLDLARQQKPLNIRELVMLSLVDRYMTTSTATLPATILADAEGDAARLRAAIDAALKTLDP